MRHPTAKAECREGDLAVGRTPPLRQRERDNKRNASMVLFSTMWQLKSGSIHDAFINIVLSTLIIHTSKVHFLFIECLERVNKEQGKESESERGHAPWSDVHALLPLSLHIAY